jgi:predicted permease
VIAILTTLAPLFIISALGYALANRNFGGEQLWHALDHITFYILFPALLAKTLMRADLRSVPASDFVLVSIGSITIMAAVIVTAYLTLRRPIPAPAFTSLFQGVLRFQSTFAVAISAALFGEKGLTFAALSVASLVPVVQLYTVLVLLIFGRGSEGVRTLPVLKRLALNPLTLACLLGLILNVTGAPGFVYETLSILGAASIALTLFAVGAGLNLASAQASRRLVAFNTAIRLIGMPLLVLFLCWLSGLTGLARTVTVISASVPTAATSYTMARKMGGDAELMVRLVAFQSAVSAITLPLFIYIAQSL